MKKLFLLLFGLVAASYAFAVTPADPTNVTWYDCGDESGHSYLTFTLPTVDVDGNPLDIEMMGYRIYTDDDQIVSFNSAVYDNVWGTTTDIYYYNWEAGSDLQSGGVYFYRTNADGYERFFNYRIGIQVFYLNSNFTIGDVSNIVYTELGTQLPKPKNPEINEWLDFAGGFSQLGITIAQTIMTGEPVADDYTVEKEFNDIEGDYTVLDPAKVTYSIFTDDDQLFVFTPEDYPYDFTEAVTEIPFNYDGFEFDMWTAHFPNHSNITEGMDRFFNWRIGLRTNYHEGENMSCSDIVYMEVYPQLQEAKNVTPTSFLADWSCDAENTFILNNFLGGGGYDLYVINKATQDTIVIKDVEPTNWSEDEYGNPFPLPGATCTVEGLTPGATYEFYVVARKNKGDKFPSVVREVTLPETLFILGEMNEQGWAPNAGTPMEYDAENNVYTATVTLDGRNSGYNYFSFTTRVAENNDAGGWDYIAPYRIGAVSNGDFLVEDQYLNMPLDLTQGQNAFQTPAGQYKLTVSLANMKLIIEKIVPDHGYDLGDVNHDKAVNISDVTALIDYLLGSGEVCPICANVNGDEGINISDVTALIDMLLSKN